MEKITAKKVEEIMHEAEEGGENNGNYQEEVVLVKEFEDALVKILDSCDSEKDRDVLMVLHWPYTSQPVLGRQQAVRQLSISANTIAEIMKRELLRWRDESGDPMEGMIIRAASDSMVGFAPMEHKPIWHDTFCFAVAEAISATADLECVSIVVTRIFRAFLEGELSLEGLVVRDSTLGIVRIADTSAGG